MITSIPCLQWFSVGLRIKYRSFNMAYQSPLWAAFSCFIILLLSSAKWQNWNLNPDNWLPRTNILNCFPASLPTVSHNEPLSSSPMNHSFSYLEILLHSVASAWNFLYFLDLENSSFIYPSNVSLEVSVSYIQLYIIP